MNSSVSRKENFLFSLRDMNYHVMSCPQMARLILSYPVLSYSILSCAAVLCLIVSYPAILHHMFWVSHHTFPPLPFSPLLFIFLFFFFSFLLFFARDDCRLKYSESSYRNLSKFHYFNFFWIIFDLWNNFNLNAMKTIDNYYIWFLHLWLFFIRW